MRKGGGDHQVVPPLKMPCNSPLAAWRTKSPGESGKLGVTFTMQDADTSLKLEIPCGRCTGCRLEKARNWAIRLVHEAKLHTHNHFVTLTYDDASLPTTVQGLPTLRPRDFQLFMKRLRKKIGGHVGQGPTAPRPSPPYPTGLTAGRSTEAGIRFYQCGEYGKTTSRPHHHALLFNLYLPDLKPLRMNARTNDAHALYRSELLEETWGNGMISVGRVNFETAAYVASYVTKKITGPMAQAHYQGRIPEYATMSRRPGIARDFVTEYQDEIYAHDTVIVRGLEMRPPKYYDQQLERRDPELYYQIRDQRAVAPKHFTKHREREARELTTKQKLRKRDAT